MTNHQHATTGPGPGPGLRPVPGAAGAAAPGTGAGEEPRAHERARTGPRDTDGQPGAGDRPDTGGQPGPGDGPGRTGEANVTGTAGAAGGPEAVAEPGSATTGGPETGGGDSTRFRRDRRHKLIAGVCSGLGRRCDMDPVIFRITLAVLAATSGIGLIFYGFAWLFVPFDDEEENQVRKLLTGRVDGHALAAVLFALVGCGVFLSMLTNGDVLTFSVVLSLLLAGAGYWSQHRGSADPDPLAAQAAADAPPEAQAPPVPAAYPSWWRDPIVKDGTHVGGTGYLWGPQESRARDVAAAVNISRGERDRQPASPSRPRPPRPRGPRWIGGWVFLFALVAGGLGTHLSRDDHNVAMSLQTGLACALGVFGLGIALSAFLGRTGAGTVLLAVVTAALLAASTTLPGNITAHWSHATWKPATVADVRPRYDLGTGEGTLDLTRIHIGKDQKVTARAEVGAGRLRVIIPKDMTLRAQIDVGVGDIQLPGDGSQDVDVAPGRHQQVTLVPEAGGKSAGTVDLDLHVGVGQAEVSRAAS
ncbi:PspC domain-containing protein [Streptomyces sp. NPDC021356]|uniref:PspC domain-containing protein n=1 Tax=Streptomyces sp. NPDC021356 TaxID=3154900 RepID=UPI00340AA066